MKGDNQITTAIDLQKNILALNFSSMVARLDSNSGESKNSQGRIGWRNWCPFITFTWSTKMETIQSETTLLMIFQETSGLVNSARIDSMSFLKYYNMSNITLDTHVSVTSTISVSSVFCSRHRLTNINSFNMNTFELSWAAGSMQPESSISCTV